MSNQEPTQDTGENPFGRQWDFGTGVLSSETKAEPQVTEADLRSAIMEAIKANPDTFRHAIVTQSPKSVNQEWAGVDRIFKDLHGIPQFASIQGNNVERFSQVMTDVYDTYSKVTTLMGGYKDSIILRDDFAQLTPEQRVQVRGLIGRQVEAQVGYWKSQGKSVPEELDHSAWDNFYKKAIAELQDQQSS